MMKLLKKRVQSVHFWDSLLLIIFDFKYYWVGKGVRCVRCVRKYLSEKSRDLIQDFFVVPYSATKVFSLILD